MANDTSNPSAVHMTDTPFHPNDKHGAQAHTRTYQACIPCRRRKVRCDLGPVDSPHDPPCARCLRENKECFFSSTRRKRKGDEEGDELEDSVLDDYEIRNGRKRVRADGTDVPAAPLRDEHAREHAAYTEPLTPGGSVGRKAPLRRPSSNPMHSSDEDEQTVNNDTTAMLQQTEVFNGQDALHLLYEAAGHNGDIKHHKTGSSGSLPEPNFHSNQADTPKSKVSGPLGKGRMGARSASLQGSALGGAADGSSTVLGSNVDSGLNNEGLQQAIQAWGKLRFVRAGWFTATEAIGYIDYFYRFLSPMTPITVPDFHNPAKHEKLLKDEPMLTVTMLAIASRYMALPGPGAVARAFAIHEKLWNFLQGMIDRMIWGQEHFGRALNSERCGGDDGSCPTAKKGLRTFGTIESLLLLTEWHTRALHFPPGDDNDELIAQGGESPSESRKTTGGGAVDELVTPSYRGRGIDSWLEPCWRSDRMSWSLLANAMALAYERGVFDRPLKQHGSVHRSENIRKLLYIYVTQTSGRLSLPSMLPSEHVESMFLESPVEKAAAIESARLAANTADTTPDNTDLKQQIVLYFWCRIAAIMKRVNGELFPNRGHTRRLITSGEYRTVMQQFGLLLDSWRREFDSCTMIPDHLRHILNIEFQYARVYANSLGLQAVVERCTNNTPSLMLANLGGSSESPPKPQSQIIPGETLRKWMEGDRKYIKEIVLATQDLLRSIVDGLLPGGYLKHSPVRTYFRVISVSMFLLKTFALGNTEEDVALSLGLLDRAASAMRTCIVDDVHVGSQFATLLGTLTHRVRSRIVRITSKAGGSSEPSRAGSRAGSPTKEDVDSGKAASQTAQRRSSKNTAQGKATQQTLKPESPRTIQGRRSQAQIQAQLQQQQQQQMRNQFEPRGLSVPPGQQGQTSPFLSFREYFPGPTQQTQNDPLYGISTSLYDPLHPTFSIMPPPSDDINGQGSYGLSENNVSNNTSQLQNAQFPAPSLNSENSYGNAFENSDWFALPLDPIVNSYGADVIQTGYGPELGGQDMLDLLLTDPTNANWQNSNGNGTNT